MIPIEQNKIENYIADYYRSYFQMDSLPPYPICRTEKQSV